MGFKLNPLTGMLDLVGSSSSSSGITGPVTSTNKAITRWNGTSGDVVQDSPGTLVQDSGAIEAQGYITNRVVTNTVTVNSTETWIAPSLEVAAGGTIVLGSGAQLIII